MQQLSKTEEQLMEYVWQYERLFMKELLELIPAPKPAPTTVATLLKRMQEKGFVGYELFGNSRQYYALISKQRYFSTHFKGVIENFFGNSALQFASFFTEHTNLTNDELEDLKRIIDQQIEKNKP